MPDHESLYKIKPFVSPPVSNKYIYIFYFVGLILFWFEIAIKLITVIINTLICFVTESKLVLVEMHSFEYETLGKIFKLPIFKCEHF